MKDKTDQENERRKDQYGVIFGLLGLPLLAFWILSGSQPHREIEELQVVNGQVEEVQLRSAYRSMPYRPGSTRICIDGTWYKVPGRYALNSLHDERSQVRMWVDGRNIWALATAEGTLLGYGGRAEHYRSQRRYDRYEAIFIAIFYVWIVGFQINLLRKGESAFSREKD